MITAIDVACFGDSTGSVAAATTGGTGSYTYLWDDPNSQTTATATGLAVGIYSLTVTDSNDCTGSSAATISQPASALSVVTDSVTHESADGALDGSITVNASGGTGTLSLSWSNGETTSTINNLDGGIYTVTVTDDNGCTASLPVTVNNGLIGISEYSNEVTFDIHPNPNNGQFTVELSNIGSGDFILEVRNIIGQLIYNKEIDRNSGDQIRIDLPSESGVYFLRLSNAASTRTEKLVVY